MTVKAHTAGEFTCPDDDCGWAGPSAPYNVERGTIECEECGEVIQSCRE